MDILFCGNDKVFDGVLTASLSIVRRLKQPRPLTVHIFTMELTRVSPDYLPMTQTHASIIENALRSHNPETTVKLYDVTDSYETHLKHNANEAATARLTPCCGCLRICTRCPTSCCTWMRM